MENYVSFNSFHLCFLYLLKPFWNCLTFFYLPFKFHQTHCDLSNLGSCVIKINYFSNKFSLCSTRIFIKKLPKDNVYIDCHDIIYDFFIAFHFFSGKSNIYFLIFDNILNGVSTSSYLKVSNWLEIRLQNWCKTFFSLTLGMSHLWNFEMYQGCGSQNGVLIILSPSLRVIEPTFRKICQKCAHYAG